MTEEEQAENTFLALANERGKFAIGVNYAFRDEQHQFALERLQEREWIRLIDISTISGSEGQVCRIFLLTKAAYDWLKETSS